MGAEQLGSASIPAKLLLDGKHRTLTLKLVDQVGGPVGERHKTSGHFEQATLQLAIKYNTVDQVVSGEAKLADWGAFKCRNGENSV